MATWPHGHRPQALGLLWPWPPLEDILALSSLNWEKDDSDATTGDESGSHRFRHRSDTSQCKDP